MRKCLGKYVVASIWSGNNNSFCFKFWLVRYRGAYSKRVPRTLRSIVANCVRCNPSHGCTRANGENETRRDLRPNWKSFPSEKFFSRGESEGKNKRKKGRKARRERTLVQSAGFLGRDPSIPERARTKLHAAVALAVRVLIASGDIVCVVECAFVRARL